MQTGPTQTTKHAEKQVFRRHVEEAKNWCGIVDNWCGHPINEIASSKKCLIPKPKG
jgi:hypothetical protein